MSTTIPPSNRQEVLDLHRAVERWQDHAVHLLAALRVTVEALRESGVLGCTPQWLAGRRAALALAEPLLKEGK